MTAATEITDNQPVVTNAVGEVETQEAPSSTAAKTFVTPSKTTVTNMNMQQDHVYSPELLKLYYARLFPYSLLCDWLAYSTSTDKNKPNKVFSRREFSMTLEPLPGEEIYIRYQSFADTSELSKAIQRRQPHKIDIGAVFSQAPKDKQAFNGDQFHPVQRELVFDIDLTDYDDIRRCGCQGAKICNKCWTYMNMAVQVMDCGLREDFGFQNIAWFYSGRRGVHAWVCDEEARFLTNEARSAVANYFEISMSKKQKSEGLLSSGSNTTTIHPMLERAYDILEPYFCRDVLPEDGHGLLSSPEQWDKLLDSLPTATARDTVGANLKQKWAKLEGTEQELSPEAKWKQLLQHLRVKFDLQDDHEEENKDSSNASTSNKRPKLSTSMHETDKEKQRIAVWPMEVVFEQTYPRLDINVSKMQNHLLKSPFCVHPKTGRVCVPINVKTINDFDPFAVPTLSRLMEELNEYCKLADGDDAMDVDFEWQKTSLKPYFEGFQRDFLVPMQKEWRRQERDQADQEAAIRGDF
ncbi:MAG: hypothetical protein SGILL_001848 [Bacillariaceae sp.]